MKNIFIIAVSLLAVGAVGAELNDRAGNQAGGNAVTPAKQATNAPVDERLDSQLQAEARDGISYWMSSQVRTTSGVERVANRSKIELLSPKPTNVVQSKTHPSIAYSGIIVQAFRNNPAQIINPFAPAKYGDGEANIVEDPVTRRAKGLKLLQISF